MLIIDELAPGAAESRMRTCLRSVVYNPLNARIAAVIDNLTLESLVGTRDSGELMYFI
jgi:hypothetical protein